MIFQMTLELSKAPFVKLCPKVQFLENVLSPNMVSICICTQDIFPTSIHSPERKSNDEQKDGY